MYIYRMVKAHNFRNQRKLVYESMMLLLRLTFQLGTVQLHSLSTAGNVVQKTVSVHYTYIYIYSIVATHFFQTCVNTKIQHVYMCICFLHKTI